MTSLTNKLRAKACEHKAFVFEREKELGGAFVLLGWGFADECGGWRGKRGFVLESSEEGDCGLDH